MLDERRRIVALDATDHHVTGRGTRDDPRDEVGPHQRSGNDGATKLLEDDDSGPLSRDARIDTGEIATTGHYCVAVTTYGDTTFGGKPGKMVVTRNAAAGKSAVTNVSVSGPKVFILSVLGGAALKADDATARQYFEKFEAK